MLADYYIHLTEDFKPVKTSILLKEESDSDSESSNNSNNNKTGSINKTVYTSDTLIMLNAKGKYWSWSYYIECEFSLTDKHLSGKRYKGKTLMKHVTGQIGAKGYPKITVGTELTSANIGKKNELTPLLRGIGLGNRELENKKKEGYVLVTNKGKILKENFTSLNQNDLGSNQTGLGFIAKEITFDDIENDINCAPIPEQFKAENKNITFPIWVTTKYDGASLIVSYHPAYGIIAYTRNRKPCLGFEDIKKPLKCLKKYPGLFLVGEIYKKGLSRNKINSIHTQNRNGTLEECGLSFYIFDCFYAIKTEINTSLTEESSTLLAKYNELIVMKNNMALDDEYAQENLEIYTTKMSKLLSLGIETAKDIIEIQDNYSPTHLTYLQRYDILCNIEEMAREITKASNESLKQSISNGNSSKPCKVLICPIKLVRCYKIDNKLELKDALDSVLEKGGEGLVARKDVEYMFSFGKAKRNPSNFKIKVFKDDEFKIVGYKLGEGKAQKNITFILAAKNQKTFSVTMNISDEEMKELYEQVIADFGQFKGRFLTVRYEQISEYGIPIFGKGISFRDE